MNVWRIVKLLLALLALCGSLTAGSAAEGDREWLTSTFRSLDLAINQGQGFSRATNEWGALAWSQSYLLEAYLEMYRGTRDTAWLEKFVSQAERIVAATDKARNVRDYRGESVVGWSSQRYSRPYGEKEGSKPDFGIANKPRVVIPSHSGMIAAPLLQFALLVRDTPALAAYAGPAQTFAQTARQAIQVFDPQWRFAAGSQEGYYLLARDMPIYGNLQLEAECNRLAMDADCALGRALVGLCLYYREPVWCEKVRALATKVKNNFLLVKDHYVWKARYKEDLHLSQAYEDLSHGAIVVAFAFDCYQAGIVFDREDMQSLSNTLLQAQREQGFAKFVDGSGDDPEFTFSDAAGRWLDLSAVDRRLYQPVFSYYQQRIKAAKAYHPQVLLGIAKLVRYHNQEK